MKRNLLSLVTLILIAALLLTGCGSEPAPVPESESPAADSPEVSDTGDSSEESPSSDETKKWYIGFANIAEEVELQVQVRESMIAAAEEHDVEIVCMNNDYDALKAVQNADDMVSLGVDAFIEFNLDASVGDVIMEKMNEAGIVTFAVDIPLPDAPFFGADNELAGKVAGKYLAESSKEDFGGEPDCILLVEDSASGEAVLARVRKAVDGFKEVYPDFPDDKVYSVDATSDASTAQKVVADFLSAHPDFSKIAIVTMHDIATTGALAAIETAGREEDCILVAQNETMYLQYIKENPKAPEHEVYKGAVAYFFDRYGSLIMPYVIDALEGKEVPDTISVPHEVVNRENAKELFPAFFE